MAYAHYALKENNKKYIKNKITLALNSGLNSGFEQNSVISPFLDIDDGENYVYYFKNVVSTQHVCQAVVCSKYLKA